MLPGCSLRDDHLEQVLHVHVYPVSIDALHLFLTHRKKHVEYLSRLRDIVRGYSRLLEDDPQSLIRQDGYIEACCGVYCV